MAVMAIPPVFIPLNAHRRWRASGMCLTPPRGRNPRVRVLRPTPRFYHQPTNGNTACSNGGQVPSQKLKRPDQTGQGALTDLRLTRHGVMASLLVPDTR